MTLFEKEYKNNTQYINFTFWCFLLYSLNIKKIINIGKRLLCLIYNYNFVTKLTLFLLITVLFGFFSILEERFSSSFNFYELICSWLTISVLEEP